MWKVEAGEEASRIRKRWLWRKGNAEKQLGFPFYQRVRLGAVLLRNWHTRSSHSARQPLCRDRAVSGKRSGCYKSSVILPTATTLPKVPTFPIAYPSPMLLILPAAIALPAWIAFPAWIALPAALILPTARTGGRFLLLCVSRSPPPTCNRPAPGTSVPAGRRRKCLFAAPRPVELRHFHAPAARRTL